MAVSGTISQTSFDIAKIVETAYRRCKLPPQRISGELSQLALDSLYLILSELGGYNQKLWATETIVVSTDVGRARMEMPDGTIDVTDANLREVQEISGTLGTRLTGRMITFDTPVRVNSIGFTAPADGTYDLLFEVSNDGVTWTQVAQVDTQAFLGNEIYWADVDDPPLCSMFCVRDVYSRDLTACGLRAANGYRETPMLKVNKTTYFQIPNKTLGGRPNQFWVDRQRDITSILIWPVPDDATADKCQVVVRRTRHLMDVGSMTNTLDVPQHWLNAIIAKLAYQLALDAVEVDSSIAPTLKAIADEQLAIALSAETDNSPINFSPGIAAYTK